jgi:hypothetical protein
MPRKLDLRQNSCYHNIHKHGNAQSGEKETACDGCAANLENAMVWWTYVKNWQSCCASLGLSPEERVAAKGGGAQLQRSDRRDAKPTSVARKAACGTCHLCKTRSEYERAAPCFANFEAQWFISDGCGRSQKVQVVSYDAAAGTHNAYVTELWTGMVERAVSTGRRLKPAAALPSPFTACVILSMKAVTYRPWEDRDEPRQWQPQQLEFEVESQAPYLAEPYEQRPRSTVTAAVRRQRVLVSEAEERELVMSMAAVALSICEPAVRLGVTFACATCTATYAGPKGLEEHLLDCGGTHRAMGMALPYLTKKVQALESGQRPVKRMTEGAATNGGDARRRAYRCAACGEPKRNHECSVVRSVSSVNK